MPTSESAAFDNEQISVRLPSEFTQSHQQALQHYFRGQEFAGDENWVLLIQAMDLLRRAQIVQSGQTETFATIYDRLVDAVYADTLIADLLPLGDPESESEPRRAVVARQIVSDLRAAGLWRSDLPGSQLLVAFYLYWWQMFVRGYAFELAIYHDLTTSGIVYVAHDLRDRRARLSGFDLAVMGFHGDIKTSTYFVQTRRSETLAHDFYITRMYHSQVRQWQRVVWLTPTFWHLLNGAPTVVEYTAIWQVLPGVAQIALRGRSFVVVLYDTWKQHLIARQQGEKAND
ncbi:MAG: hypothetical protein R3C14_32095 [Caldilineaceae bacterium]